MTMTDEARTLFDALTPLRWPVSAAEVERALRIKLTQVDSDPDRFEGSFSLEAFEHVKFVVLRVEPKAFLVASARKGVKLVESAMHMEQYGTLAIVGINPRMLPEGTISFGCNVGITRVSWQFTTTSRVLGLIRFEWHG
jgi:hypothetical protein